MRTLALLLVFLVACDDESRPSQPSLDMEVDVAQDMVSDVASDLDADIPPSLIPEGCNPVAYEHDCFFPFPSDFFRKDGKIQLEGAAAIRNAQDQEVDILGESNADGFSPHPGIVIRIRGGFDHESLIFHTGDVEKTVTAPLQTVLINATTGERVPHFAERFEGSTQPELQYLAIRPMVRLSEGVRYVVGIRNLTRGGEPLSPPEGFREIATGLVRLELESELARYEGDIFPVLKASNFEREQLYAAWDFTVRTQATIEGDLLHLRSLALDALQQNPVTVHEVTVLETLPATVVDNLSRVVRGEIEVPNFLSNANTDGRLVRGADGLPELSGTVRVPFVVTIPKSVWEADPTTPARMVQFGHGLFGTRDEIVSTSQSSFANDVGVVMISVDWWGFSAPDRDLIITRLLNDPAKTFAFTDRVQQAFINHIALGDAIAGALKQVPELQKDGQPIFDSEGQYFMGLSAGHILGSTFVALSPRVEQAVLHVGGGSFGLVMTRSLSFALLEVVISQIFGADRTQKVITIAPQLLDVIDPIAWAPRMFANPVEGVPTRRILMQEGLSDTAVPNVGTELHARVLGLPLLDNSPRPVWGLETVQSAPSALVQIDFGVDPDPAARWREPTSKTITHDKAREVPEIREQISVFLTPGGEVTNTCGDLCKWVEPN